METDDYEWELSKENVQPLRQGRHVSALVAALHSDQGQGDEQHVIKTQQNQFEMELRTYSGDDPLDVWDRYIKWTEQYYPKGGHDGQLMKLLEQCLKAFQNDPRYADDQRFIRIWVKFANLTKDPVEVFSYMFDIGIGTTVAPMYVEWAIALEKIGDLRKADAIYTEGLNRRAQSKDMLCQMHMQFQTRVAKNITLQVSENIKKSSIVGEEEKETRSALNRLKTHGTRSLAGVIRTGNAVKGLPGTLKDSRSGAPKQIPGKGFSIFNDAENRPPSLQPQQTKEWKTLPTKEVNNRENDRTPGVWTDAKLKQRPVAGPKPVASFEIHEDPCATPQRQACPTAMMGHQPLSSRKAGDKPDVLSNLRQPTFTPNTGIPMYQKDKIYNGLKELSFEELRAERYWKLRRQREERQLEEEKKQKEILVQRQLAEQQARIAALEAALLQTGLGGNGPGSSEAVLGSNWSTPDSQLMLGLSSHGTHSGDFAAQSNRPDPSSTLETKPALAVVRSSTPMEDESSSLQPLPKSKALHLSDSTPSSSNSNVSSLSAVTASGGEAPSLPSLSSCEGRDVPAATASFSKETVDHPQLRQSRPSSTTPSSAGPTPESFSLGRGPMSAPSPTVHTKEAYQDILGMFNTTFDPDSFIDPSNNCKTPSKSMEVGEVVSVKKDADPFEIFEDSLQTGMPAASKQDFFVREDTVQSGNNNLAASVKKDPGPFQIFEDAMQTGSPAESKPAFSVREDTVPGSCRRDENVNFSRGALSERKGSSSTASKLGFSIFEDVKQEENNRPVPTSQCIAPDQTDPEFKIYYGQLQDENSGGAKSGSSMKKSTRRGLAFSSALSSLEDIEMVPDCSHIPEYTIESQAKHDQTLAPLDDFSHHARAASTPFGSGQPVTRTSQHQAQETSNMQTGCASYSNSTNMTASYASNFRSTDVTPSKDLSPIFEGSNEGSNEESKSLHLTAASSSNVTHRSRHGSSSQSQAVEVHEPRDIGNVSMEDEEAKHAELAYDLDKTCHHDIDTTTYIPDPDQVEGTQALFSTSICIDPKDPFDDVTIEHFLATLEPPIQDYKNYIQCRGPMPSCESEMPFNEVLTFDECIGEGGNASVWKMSEFMALTMVANSMAGALASEKALKMQKSGGQWEFYITSELLQRLAKLGGPVDVRPAILEIEKGYFFDNGSALQMEYIPNGSFLNLVNVYRRQGRLSDGVEPFACLLTIELLRLFESIHACNIIHGDVKPDNFLMLDLPELPPSSDPREVFGSQLQMVKLIDFGQSIDLTKFPAGTTFTAKVVTSGFQCIEMKTNQPWTFQTDLFGLAGTVHVILFGSYMKVFQEHGTWRTTANFVRKWNVPLWKRLFHELLNIPSCSQQPDLGALRAQFEDYFMSHLRKDYNAWVRRMQLVLNSS